MRQSTLLMLAVACLLLGGCKPSAQADAEDAGNVSDPATETPTVLPADQAATIAAHFRCGDLLLGIDFDNAAETATLSWSGHRRVLPQAVAASGARYADDAGTEFWNKGDDATLTLDGNAAVECTVTDEVSPWDDARARGVTFRGIGTEPGWLVEVDGGSNPSLRAQLEYGERNVEASGLDAAPDGSRYAGTTSDGTSVVLAIVEGDCSDGMSDQTFPASIELTVGDQSFRGCGAYLDR